MAIAGFSCSPYSTRKFGYIEVESVEKLVREARRGVQGLYCVTLHYAAKSFLRRSMTPNGPNQKLMKISISTFYHKYWIKLT